MPSSSSSRLAFYQTCILLTLFLLACSSDAAAVPESPPSGDQCLTEGYFCFEVTKGPRYSYRIHPDEERVLFSMYAIRITNSTFAWNMSLHESIDDGHASILFLQQGQEQPSLKLEVNKQEGDKLVFKLYEWLGEKDWNQISIHRRAELYHDLVKQDHSVRFNTTPKFDELLGLESKNLTIGIQIKTDLVSGESAKELIEFSTQDGHYFFQDKPEIREYRGEEKAGPTEGEGCHVYHHHRDLHHCRRHHRLRCRGRHLHALTDLRPSTRRGIGTAGHPVDHPHASPGQRRTSILTTRKRRRKKLPSTRDEKGFSHHQHH